MKDREISTSNDKNLIANEDLHQIVVHETVHLKIILIAQFKKSPYPIDKDFSHQLPYFDLSNAGSLAILAKYGFRSNLFACKKDIKACALGGDFFTVLLSDDSSINIKEFMISSSLRKTETNLVIKNISAKTLIEIISEIDREKYLCNGSKPENLFIEISGGNPALENLIKESYCQAGFTLLKNNPAITNTQFLLKEISLLSSIGLFNYAQRHTENYFFKFNRCMTLK